MHLLVSPHVEGDADHSVPEERDNAFLPYPVGVPKVVAFIANHRCILLLLLLLGGLHCLRSLHVQHQYAMSPSRARYVCATRVNVA